MTTTKVKDLMVIERLLLEIEVRFKFDLQFNDAYKLYELLKSVGKITSYAFLIQDEYGEKFSDNEGLKQYHDMVMNSDIEFNSKEAMDFINKVNDEMKDDDFKNILKQIKFW